MNVVGVILAAGFGMRLRPSTERCPKPLIPVGGIEPLFFAIHRFHNMGIHRIVVNAHHLNEQIRDALKAWKEFFPDIEFRLSVEQPEILGTGGALLKIIQENTDWFVKDQCGLLLQNGDTLAHFDFKPFLKNTSRCTFAISFLEDHLKKYNPLWISKKDGSWLGIGKTPHEKDWVPAHFLGVHYLSPKAILVLSKTEDFKVCEIDLFNGIYRPLVNQGFVFESFEGIKKGQKNAFWFDMTTREFLLEAQRFVLESHKDSKFWGELLVKRYPGIREVQPGVWLSRSVLQEGCTYRSPLVWVEKDILAKKPENPAYERGSLILGPHASLISEGNAFTVSRSKGELKIQNAIVFLNRNSSENLPASLSDALCVV